MHVDMNSYFASVEQQANPLLRGKPIGVTGKRKERSVVAAASREAKKLGVKTAMSTWEAKRICPSIILIMGDPEKYAEITERFNRIFRDVADAVERFSVDESFLDVTCSARDYLGAVATAQTIRRRLRESCGEWITASIGIGPNKLVAKAASESEKPNGLVAVPPSKVLEFLDARGLQDLCGIGPRIAERLEALGLRSFRHIREYPLSLLEAEFHSYGRWLYRAAWGQDDTSIADNAQARKSVGHSYTLPADASDPRVVRRFFLRLCDQVAWRLRRDGQSGRTVHVYLRYGDFHGWGTQKHLLEPVQDGLEIFRIAWALIARCHTPSSFRDLPVRLVGVSVSELVDVVAPPQLFVRAQKQRGILPALDRLQHRFGNGVWSRASLLSTPFLPRASGFAYDHEL